MTTVNRETRDVRDTAVGFATLPVREHVLDRLADVMLDTDDILDALASDAAEDLRCSVPRWKSCSIAPTGSWRG